MDPLLRDTNESQPMKVLFWGSSVRLRPTHVYHPPFPDATHQKVAIGQCQSGPVAGNEEGGNLKGETGICTLKLPFRA